MHMCVPSLPCARRCGRVCFVRAGDCMRLRAREGEASATVPVGTYGFDACLCAQAAGPRAQAMGWAV